MKQLWLLVGGNGAGKSTFYRLVLEPLGLPFVNADRLAQLVDLGGEEERSYEAALLEEQQRNTLLLSGASFCFETVYSHPSKIDFTARAKALGYFVIMVVIHLEQAELNTARVAQRVREGGHNVPIKKLLTRIPRMLEQVKASIPLCDELRVFDNSSAEDPFQPVMTIKMGEVELHQHPVSRWAAQLLDRRTSSA